MLTTVPTIDIALFLDEAPGAAEVVQQVARACEDIGFFGVTGHGIDPSMRRHAVETARSFFRLPFDEKQRARAPGLTPRGYLPIGLEGLSYSRGEAAPADLKEAFQIGPEYDDAAYYHAPEALPHFHPNLWPERPPAMRQALTDYYRAMNGLARELMRIFALGLDLPKNFFDGKIDRHITVMRMLHYPEQRTAPVAGQMRAGAHSDYGSLTILHSENVEAGLQVVNKAGDWVDVTAPAGSFIINIGDLMMRWTNDRWISTLHRVVNPPAARASSDARLSIAFFHHPNYDTEVACLPGCADAARPVKYPPVNAGPYRLQKYSAARSAFMPAS